MYKRTQNIGLLLLWALIFSAGPFMFLLIEWYPSRIITGAVSTVFLVALLANRKVVLGDVNILLILAIQAIFFLFAEIYHSDLAYVSLSIRMIAIAVIYMFINTYITISETAKSVLLVMAIIGVLGVIAFFAAATGHLEPVSALIKSNDDLLYNYILTFSNSVFVGLNGMQFMRVSGFFEEPGALAYYLTYALIINKLLLDSRKFESVFVVSGLFTMSLAFFITALIYYSFFYINKRTYKRFLFVILLAISSIIYIEQIKDETPLARTIYSITVDRLQFSDDGDGAVIKGNDRVDSFRDGIKYIGEKPLLGYGFTSIFKDANFSNASILSVIVVDGIIGFIFNFMHVLYLFVHILIGKNIHAKVLMAKIFFILAINYLQRPHVNEIFSYLLVVIIVTLLKKHIKANFTVFGSRKNPKLLPV